jgi:hypothetical protein
MVFSIYDRIILVLNKLNNLKRHVLLYPTAVLSHLGLLHLNSYLGYILAISSNETA